MGRCEAKLGHMREATTAFEAGIAEAHRCELPFIEMLIRRDLITSVLDEQCSREEQMAALGACISSMVLPPVRYTAVLGSDIDAASAVAAWQASKVKYTDSSSTEHTKRHIESHSTG